MEKVYFVLRDSSPETLRDLSRRIAQVCTQQKIMYGMEPQLRGLLPRETEQAVLSLEECGCICSVGGDGTLLKAATLAVKSDKPVLGLNIGRVGFLTEAEFSQFPDCIQALRMNRYCLDERMMLKVQANGREELALNDVVVSKGDPCRTIGLEIDVSGESLGRLIADGVIVSTPTGSTGYALSAGGPVISPNLDCLLITPVCAHSMGNRPVIVSPEKTVTITIGREYETQAAVSCDGRQTVGVSRGKNVLITRAAEKVRFIRFHNMKFLELVKTKLNTP